MIVASLFLGAVLTAVVTNSPSSFSTETEYILPCPSLAERDTWLTCEILPITAVSNRLELAFGADGDNWPSTGIPLVWTLDGSRMCLSSPDASDAMIPDTSSTGTVRLDIHPGKGDVPNTCEIMTNGVPEMTTEWVSANSSIRSWIAMRIRMSGPDPATASITLRRCRFAFNIFIR